MNIPAPVLKALLKKLSGAKGDTIVLDTKNGVLFSKDNGLEIYVVDDQLKDESGDVFFFPAKKFTPSVSKMSGTVTIQKTDKDGYLVQSNKTKIVLEKGYQAWSFKLPTDYPISIDTKKLQKVVSFVQIAADPKQQAMTFAGLISLAGKQEEDFLAGSYLEAVATDGKRISIATENADVDDFNLLLPATLAAVFPLLTGETTEFFDNDNGTFIKSDNLYAFGNKFTAKFPDAKKLLPESSDFGVVLYAADLKDALDRIQPMLDEDTRAVELSFGDKLRLRTVGKGGSGQDEVESITQLPGHKPVPYAAIFDHKFLTDFLSVVMEKISIENTTGKDFAVFSHYGKKYLLSRMAGK
jgi:DNA polymerase III sliding clamp (beta) subunit (PCNA family)